MPTYKDSNLFIFGNAEKNQLHKLILYVDAAPVSSESTAALVYARVDMGGTQNPLLQIMPKTVEIELNKDDPVKTVANLIALEASMSRCGGQFALDRLCDLLVVNILRNRLESNQTEPGIFAGLAHPKLRHVVVAIHDDPGRPWKVDDFVELAGMSRSQFMATFQRTLGKSPMAYLKLWRMTAARNSLLKGGRVKEVARRFGYGSGDAFCRAFVATYGRPPTQLV
ncbi:AraC family transcriptional regulator [Exilibacterium tricleocarpae]|nr:AraC family transcriptional regulator [Exilibacterium tricleocarpae]